MASVTSFSWSWIASSLSSSLAARNRASAYTRAISSISRPLDPPLAASPLRAEKSTSASASSTRRFWSSALSDLRTTFSVVRTVSSATSLRMRSSERRVSASMSRRAAATSSSRFSLPSSAAWDFAESAALRARATMSSACSRASFRRAWYSAVSCSASVLLRSAASIDSAISLARLSSASWIRGKTFLLRKKTVIPKNSSVQIISPRPGDTRKLPPSSSPSVAATSTCPMSMTNSMGTA